MRENRTFIILSPGFPADETDSTCLPAQQQFVQVLHESFPSLQIVLLSFQYPYTQHTYTWNGIEVMACGGGNRNRIYRLLTWVRVWMRLKKLYQHHHVIGLFSFWYDECALIGKWFGKRKQLKHFTWIAGQDARKGNRYVTWLKPDPDELIAMSDFLVSEFERNYGIRPAHVIPNGIDPKRFADVVYERDIDLLGAGSLIALKRYDVFIETVKALKKHFPEIRAMICGEGAERKSLEKMIVRYGLQHNIVLAGEKPHAAVLQLMQRSKVLLHPSSYEGFSGACLEALGAGAHVISFCNPKNAWVRQWHIAEDTGDMTSIAHDIIGSADTLYRPVLPYTMQDSVRAVMKLFSN